ncbi:MAG: SurA N-terminal domain-containing protein, partial [Alphaproteobacteria bacterium]|nr:SurA N-terminal domain-containing protein [Alphaproteobacteria bacterium]
MKTTKVLATLLLSAVLFSGCTFKDQKAVIKVNNHAITQGEFDKLLEQQIESSPFAKMGDLKSNKDGFLYLMNAQSVVNQLVVQELMDQEAKNRGIKVTNKDVDAE